MKLPDDLEEGADCSPLAPVQAASSDISERIGGDPRQRGRLIELVARHADLPLGAVDASVIAAAERLGTSDIATLDLRHVTVVRSNTGILNLLP